MRFIGILVGLATVIALSPLASLPIQHAR
jgi:hypothetical protein